jgi:4-oxalomesaconate tautomerase
VAVVGPPSTGEGDRPGGDRPGVDRGVDVEYLFLQVSVDQPLVSDSQNCGNLLAGVGPFAVERGLVTIDPEATEAELRILMVNTNSVAVARFPVADGQPVYRGDTTISGVPATAAAIRLDFEGIAGGSTGALLPTGNQVDRVAGVDVTMVDNGMPVVAMLAADLNITGHETCAQLEADEKLRAAVEKIRLEAGSLMGLGDVTDTTVPKMALVAPPADGGHLCTRMFIPHRCHDAIGVLAAVSVATAGLLAESPVAGAMTGGGDGRVVLEHPTGSFEAAVDIELDNGVPAVKRAGIVRTARKLMDGVVFPRSEM